MEEIKNKEEIKGNEKSINQKDRNKESIAKIIYILKVILVIAWMLLVFWFSSQIADESSTTSGTVIRTAITIVDKDMPEEKVDSLVEILQPITRKTAHLTLFTLGGFLIYAWISSSKNVDSTKKKILLTILVGILYAITDELHQAFVPGRGPGILDVAIDSTGIIIGMCLCLLCEKLYKKLFYSKKV